MNDNQPKACLSVLCSLTRTVLIKSINKSNESNGYSRQKTDVLIIHVSSRGRPLSESEKHAEVWTEEELKQEVNKARSPVCFWEQRVSIYILLYTINTIFIMKVNENTLLEGNRAVLVPYNREHVPRWRLLSFSTLHLYDTRV